MPHAAIREADRWMVERLREGLDARIETAKERLRIFRAEDRQQLEVPRRCRLKRLSKSVGEELEINRLPFQFVVANCDPSLHSSEADEELARRPTARPSVESNSDPTICRQNHLGDTCRIDDLRREIVRHEVEGTGESPPVIVRLDHL